MASDAGTASGSGRSQRCRQIYPAQVSVWHPQGETLHGPDWDSTGYPEWNMSTCLHRSHIEIAGEMCCTLHPRLEHPCALGLGECRPRLGLGLPALQ